MPPRKKTKEEPKPEDASPNKTEDAKDANAPATSGNTEEKARDAETKSKDDSGQLFFSTDGSAPEKEEKNPYIEDGSKVKPKQTEETTASLPVESPSSGVEKKGNEQQTPKHPHNNKQNRGNFVNYSKEFRCFGVFF